MMIRSLQWYGYQLPEGNARCTVTHAAAVTTRAATAALLRRATADRVSLTQDEAREHDGGQAERER